MFSIWLFDILRGSTGLPCRSSITIYWLFKNAKKLPSFVFGGRPSLFNASINLLLTAASLILIPIWYLLFTSLISGLGDKYSTPSLSVILNGLSLTSPLFFGTEITNSRFANSSADNMPTIRLYLASAWPNLPLLSPWLTALYGVIGSLTSIRATLALNLVVSKSCFIYTPLNCPGCKVIVLLFSSFLFGVFNAAGIIFKYPLAASPGLLKIINGSLSLYTSIPWFKPSTPSKGNIDVSGAVASIILYAASALPNVVNVPNLCTWFFWSKKFNRFLDKLFPFKSVILYWETLSPEFTSIVSIFISAAVDPFSITFLFASPGILDPLSGTTSIFTNISDSFNPNWSNTLLTWGFSCVSLDSAHCSKPFSEITTSELNGLIYSISCVLGLLDILPAAQIFFNALKPFCKFTPSWLSLHLSKDITGSPIIDAVAWYFLYSFFSKALSIGVLFGWSNTTLIPILPNVSSTSAAASFDNSLSVFGLTSGWSDTSVSWIPACVLSFALICSCKTLSLTIMFPSTPTPDIWLVSV